MKKQVNFEIDNGDTFFADEITIVHNPTKVIFDFKNISPRFDVRNKDTQPIKIKHNVIVVDVFTAKEIVRILKDNIKNYEKRFGKIEIPKAMQLAQKEMKKKKKKSKDIESPAYFG